MRVILPYFLITMRRNNLDNISLIEGWNHRVFVNTWTADYKYPLPDFGNLPFPIKSSYLQKKKHFLGFLFHLWNLHQILNNFKKKKIVIGNVFPKLATVQGLVTPLTIQRRLKTSFDSQHVKRFQRLVKTPWEYFYHIFFSLWGERIWKTSPWLKFGIIGLFLNTWTGDYEYPVPDCQNFPFRIRVQLSLKQKKFSRLFIPLMQSPSNFEHFQKKEDPHS